MKFRNYTPRIFRMALFAALWHCGQSTQAQSESGHTAPNFTATDINGESHELYDYLREGHPVILQFAKTWSTPSWDFHSSGVLQALHTAYGVDNGGDLVIMLIESDSTTTLSDLQGMSGSTQGNWLEGTEYIVIDSAEIALLFQVKAFPDNFIICPNGNLFESGWWSETEFVDFIESGACQTTLSHDAAFLPYTGPRQTCGETELAVEIINLGTSALTEATLSTTGTNPAFNVGWSGNLAPFESEMILLGNAEISDQAIISLSSDENDSNNFIHATERAPLSSLEWRFSIHFDSWPGECSWEVQDSEGAVVLSGGPYTEESNGSTIQFDRSLPAEDCYAVILRDSQGDGLHGSQWEGGSGADGSFRIQSIENGEVYGDILNYDGSFDYTELRALAQAAQSVSVQEEQNLVSMSLFPNPASLTTTLRIDGSQPGKCNIRLTDILGKTIWADQRTVNDQGSHFVSIPLAGISGGIYQVQVSLGNAQHRLTLLVN